MIVVITKTCVTDCSPKINILYLRRSGTSMSVRLARWRYCFEVSYTSGPFEVILRMQISKDAILI